MMTRPQHYDSALRPPSAWSSSLLLCSMIAITTAYHHQQSLVLGSARMVRPTMNGQNQRRPLPFQSQTRRKHYDVMKWMMMNSGSSSNTDNDKTVPSLSSPNDPTTLLPHTTETIIIDPSTTIEPTTKEQQQEQQGLATIQHDKSLDRDWTKQNLAIALPALMGLLADPLLSMVDTGFVGQGGAIDLAALGVCTSIFHMAFTVFRASTVATTSLVGSAPSEGERRQITKISLVLAGVMGTVVTLALRLGGPRMLATMGVPSTSSLYRSASSYLFIRCWAAPAVVGMVVAEGAFRGNGDNRTPLIASSVAAGINLLLDPLLMFPLGMGMAGAAVATAISQVCAFGLYGWRLWKRKLLPQAQDAIVRINVPNVIKSILGANAAMLAKNFSMLVFYTSATAVATRMGPAHIATHQVCLSLFWLTTMWLDSGTVSAQILMSRNLNDPSTAKSLMKYMTKFALVQGLVFSAGLVAVRRYIPSIFTTDPTIIEYIGKCLPHVAIQQTIVSVCLVWEGLVVGGNQFRYMAMGTAACTMGGLWQMSRATSVVDIWACTVNAFFCMRLISALLGVTRVVLKLNKKEQQ